VPACAHYICTQAGQLTSTVYIDNIVAKQRDGQSQRVLSVSLPLLAGLLLLEHLVATLDHTQRDARLLCTWPDAQALVRLH